MNIRGFDSTEGLVGLHTHGKNKMRCYFRHPDDSVTYRDYPFTKSAWLTDTGAAVLRAQGIKHSRSNLSGDGEFRHLCRFEEPSEFKRANRELTEAADKLGISRKDLIYSLNPVSTFLIETGMTMFKGMGYDGPRRMQIDIETLSPSGGFSTASKEEDEIVIIAMSDNRGWHRIIHQDPLTEEEILIEMIKEIWRRDPDIIEGHNIFMFDLPYIETRCRYRGVNFVLGRNGKRSYGREARRKFAERQMTYQAYTVHGRAVIDTMFLAYEYDVFYRGLTSYSLKPLAKHFGVAAPDRQYVDGGDITRSWFEDRDKLIRYAKDDVDETRQIGKILGGATFYKTQMVPMSYARLHCAGIGSQIESLFIREYLRERVSLPKPERGRQEAGGLTAVLRTGIFEDIIYADVESLYPSIMLNYDIRPERDQLGIFPEMLRSLTALRLATKQRMNDAKAEGRLADAQELEAEQTSYKTLINSFYGMLGYSMALFNDFSEADRVATTGQDILRQMSRLIDRMGGDLIEIDTDGVLFGRGSIPYSAQKIVETLTEALPDGITVGLDGEFDRMISLKKKNYVLLGKNGKIKMKGGSLKARSMERFLKAFLDESIKRLLEFDFDGLADLYDETARRIIEGKIPISDLCRRVRLRMSIDEYDEKGNAALVAYELARQAKQFDAGTLVSYYISNKRSGSDVVGRRSVSKKPPCSGLLDGRLEEDFDGDVNVAWYLYRLKETVKRFEPLFDPLVFKDLFEFPRTVDLFQPQRTHSVKIIREVDSL